MDALPSMPPLGWRKHKDGKQAKGAAAPKTPKTPREPEPNKSSATSTLQAALFDLMTRHGKASCTFTEIYQHITRWFRPYSSSDIKFALNTVLLNTLSPSWLTEELKNGKRHYKLKDDVLERMKVKIAEKYRPLRNRMRGTPPRPGAPSPQPQPQPQQSLRSGPGASPPPPSNRGLARVTARRRPRSRP